jgi:hypothetical protein
MWMQVPCVKVETALAGSGMDVRFTRNGRPQLLPPTTSRLVAGLNARVEGFVHSDAVARSVIAMPDETIGNGAAMTVSVNKLYQSNQQAAAKKKNFIAIEQVQQYSPLEQWSL